MNTGPVPLVALAGNPNAGKTTLFNRLTGSRARVGNYPGVTVEKRLGQMTLPGVGKVDVVDVPGTYSLVARTGEEQIALESMVGLQGEPRPDVVVVCVDATQTVRGCYLALQALELGLPVVVALTMMDEALKTAADPKALGKRLGCEVVAVSATRKTGMAELIGAVARRLENPHRKEIWTWKPSVALAAKLAEVRATLPAAWPQNDAMAVWALMSVEPGDDLVGIPAPLRKAVALPEADQKLYDDEAVCGRYAFLDREVAGLERGVPDRRRSAAVDRVLIHPVAGLAIFLLLMFGLFQALFTGAEPIISAIETLFVAIGNLAKRGLGDGVVGDFVADGLFAGVGSVMVFLPQILMLFFFLSILDDSGYMARVAYMMDRIMRAMSLHGRAFVPILSGFACAIPAILATRTMERRRDRLLTMLVVPLTTCSARLPVYSLIIASLFRPRKLLGVVPLQGSMMVFMYAFGIASALAAAWVLSRAIKPLRAKRLPFVIELPPYRMPRMGDVIRSTWQRSRRFLTESGTVIVVGSIILWALLAFPREIKNPSQDWTRAIAQATTDQNRDEVTKAKDGERLQQSYAGRLGKFIEPTIAPMGFDWKIGIGLIGAFAAREVFVATVGVVYGVGNDVEDDLPLRQKLRDERRPDGSLVYTPLVGLSLMLFFALACQCMGTLAVVRRETGTLVWPVFLFAYMTTLAWIVSTAVYQGGRALGWG